MPVSKSEDKMFALQSQLRQNQTDLSSFLGDLDKWTNEIKEKDETLKTQNDVPQKDLPPVRNSQDKKKKRKKKKEKPQKNESESRNGKAKRISGYDYRSWDTFDVDKACEDVDEEKANDGERDGAVSLSDLETDSEASDEEWDVIQLQQQAIEEKNKGNECFNKGDYEAAIEWYSKGTHSDPTNAMLPANRAMSLLKLGRFGAAEVDATQAIMLDPMYFKAYLRRAAARVGLKKFEMAREDYRKLLNLDPGNKTAKSELVQLEKELNRTSEDRAPVSCIDIQEEGIVKPIYKPAEQCSKKPLKRIEIQEIGVEMDQHRKTAILKTKSTQSVKTREIVAKNNERFEQLTTSRHVSANTETSLKPQIEEMSTQSITKIELEADESKIDSEARLQIQEVTSAKSSSSSSQKAKNTSHRTETPKIQPAFKLDSPRSADLIEMAKQKQIPRSSFQFQADYKELKNDTKAFYEYFQRIDPATYGQLFGEAIDADILLSVFTVLHKFYIPSQINCFNHLKCLSQVSRFSVTILFMSKKEKQGIKDLFSFIQENHLAPIEEIQKLLKVYQM